MAEALLRYSHGEAKFTAATTYASGQIIQLSDGRAGVIAGLNAIASGDAVTAYTAGVFAVATASATTFSKGDPVYWDDSASVAVATPGEAADVFLGLAMDACANGDTTVAVDLNATPNVAARAAWRTPGIVLDWEDTASYTVVLAAENPNGLLVDEFTGIVVEAGAGASEDQLVATLYDEDDNALSVCTFADSGADASGDLIQGTLTTATGATGVVAAVIPAGKSAYVKISQATSGSGAAGTVRVSALVSPLI